jgi:shikimate dehydrogenase
MTDQYAVIGNPIEHSRSPQIHAAFAEQTGQDIRYVRLLGDVEQVERDFDAFFDGGGKGLNVTVPFKERACRYATELSERAAAAGAVNTLIAEGGTVRGDNTDGVGLVRDLRDNHGFGLAGARVLLLGAGGAAKGVLHPLLASRPVSLFIANRTADKAVHLARAARDGRVAGGGLGELDGRRFDLIINATAAGLDAKVPPLPDDCLAAEGWVYDMVYGREPTAFMRWGVSHGAGTALDGLGMLVEQAAESFYLWRGVRPLTLPVIEALRHES